MPSSLTIPNNILDGRASKPAITRARMLSIAGGVVALGLLVMLAMLWQSFNSAREANRQKIIAALDNAVAEIHAQTVVVETTAQLTERIVRAIDPTNSASLRTALETTVTAFEERPELSHLGLILPDANAYGNLERIADGSILLWLYPGANDTGDVTQSLRLTDAGFVPHAKWPGRDEDLHMHPVYQAALKGPPEGSWQLRIHPWMAHDHPRDPPWGISYTKALYDDAGGLIGVLDANFNMSTVQTYLDAMEAKYGIQLDVIEQSDPPRRIGGEKRAPRPIPDIFAPLLTAPPETAFVDTMQIDNARFWVAARPLTVKGDIPWMVVASRPVPLYSVIPSEQLWQALAMVLAITAASVLVFKRVVHRLREGHATDADLEYLATHDKFIGLPNRVLMQQRITQAIAQARETGEQVALLYLDLDRFKTVNDTYGYLFGNTALKEVGAAFVRMVRPQDTVAYLNGDRFLILLTGLRDQIEAERLIRHFMKELQQSIVVQEREIHLTASIGVAMFPQHGDTPDALINCADIAMDQAKKQGRSVVKFFNVEMGLQVQQRIALETRLQDAVDAGQLHLVYQPKVSLETGQIVGCEALLRWTHPEQGEISPAYFVPIAEESGLIIPIGDWVLETACRQAKRWLDAGLTPVRVAVNLSVGQFLRRDVVTWVADTLQRTGLPAHCLQLELTESLPPKNMEETIATFKQFQTIGVILALDDFGTGYSNLGHLKRFPIHTLKIDQSFVRQAMTSPQDAAIVRAIITLAHKLNFKALAEGVETREQLDFLREEGCDEIQGYYFSKPLSPEMYAIWLREDIKLT